MNSQNQMFPCPFCQGTGRDEHKACDVCGGTTIVPQDVVDDHKEAQERLARRLKRHRRRA